MLYFLDITKKEISVCLKLVQSTVHYHKNDSLRLLRKLMEWIYIWNQRNTENYRSLKLSRQLSKVTPKQSIRYFPIFSHLLIVSARENIRMNLGEFIMWLMNIWKGGWRQSWLQKFWILRSVYNKRTGIFPFYSRLWKHCTLIIEYFILQDVRKQWSRVADTPGWSNINAYFMTSCRKVCTYRQKRNWRWIGARKYHAMSRGWELCGEDSVSNNDTSGEAVPVWKDGEIPMRLFPHSRLQDFLWWKGRMKWIQKNYCDIQCSWLCLNSF